MTPRRRLGRAQVDLLDSLLVGPWTVGGLASELGRDHGSLHLSLTRLRRDGLVTRVGAGTRSDPHIYAITHRGRLELLRRERARRARG